MYKKIIIGGSLALIMTTGALQAQSEEDGLALGVGAAFSTTIYKGMDDQGTILPMIQYQKGGFYIQGLEAGYKVVESELADVKLFLEGRMDGYEADDSDYFAGMDDRDKSLDGGVQVSLKLLERTELSFSWQHDLLDEYQGHEATVSLGTMYFAGKTLITPFIGASYLSEDLAGYYYGVRPEEATVDRMAYEPGEGFSGFAGVSVMHSFDKNWMGMLNLIAVGYSDEITDSPIVDEDHQLSAMGGVVYRF